MSKQKDTSRVRFTANRVGSFACPSDKCEAWLWDEATPGLALRAQGATVSYVFQRKMNGRAMRVVIGRREAWPLESVWTGAGAERREIQRGAREEARRLSALVDSGVNPLQERRDRLPAERSERERASRGAVTLSKVWDSYVATMEADWGEGHRRNHDVVMQAPGLPRKRAGGRTTIAGPLWGLRNEPLQGLTADRIANWLEKETKKRPTIAALAFRMLRACLRWAADRPKFAGMVDAAALLSKDVRRKVPSPKAKSDCLQREQLKPWFDAVRTLPPATAIYLQTLLITGSRPGELVLLRWRDADLQWGAITIRDKVVGERTIPISPYIATLLQGLPRRNRWVFSSAQSDTGRIGPPNRAHSRVVAAAGLPPLTLHGLRRYFGTLSEWVEATIGVVAQIMGHRPSAIAEKHYRRRPIDLLRLWHEKIENWILEQAGLGTPKMTDGTPTPGLEQSDKSVA